MIKSNKNFFIIISKVCLLFIIYLFLLPPLSFCDDTSRFKEYEIRVIRKKYFTKKGRFELGLQTSMIMNNTFVYTLMGTGILSYHVLENWALEFSGAIGHSFDRDEKRVLDETFQIKTEIFRTFYMAEGAVLYTPAYGKLQLTNKGRLIYYDTYIAVGGGMTGVNWQYSDYCTIPETAPDETSSATVKDDAVIAYPTGIIGIGQRIFYSKTKALKWDLRMHWVMYSTDDSNCNPNATGGGSDNHQSITFQIGGSKFF